MSSPFFPLQKEIYRLLTNDTELMNKITGVFDYVPERELLPYVVIGEGQSSPGPWSGAWDVQAVIRIWSNYEGFKEVSDILADVYRILANKHLTVEGFEDAVIFHPNTDDYIDVESGIRGIDAMFRVILSA